jgi:hypothetical protein
VNGVRLGDELDDYCIKCRRITNHAIVSVVDDRAAKVRCRSCYNDHDFRNSIAPPTKRELKKQQELYDAVLQNAAPPQAVEVDGDEADPRSPQKKSASGKH